MSEKGQQKFEARGKAVCVKEIQRGDERSAEVCFSFEMERLNKTVQTKEEDRWMDETQTEKQNSRNKVRVEGKREARGSRRRR